MKDPDTVAELYALMRSTQRAYYQLSMYVASSLALLMLVTYHQFIQGTLASQVSSVSQLLGLFVIAVTRQGASRRTLGIGLAWVNGLLATLTRDIVPTGLLGLVDPTGSFATVIGVGASLLSIATSHLACGKPLFGGAIGSMATNARSSLRILTALNVDADLRALGWTCVDRVDASENSPGKDVGRQYERYLGTVDKHRLVLSGFSTPDSLKIVVLFHHASGPITVTQAVETSVIKRLLTYHGAVYTMMCNAVDRGAALLEHAERLMSSLPHLVSLISNPEEAVATLHRNKGLSDAVELRQLRDLMERSTGDKRPIRPAVDPDIMLLTTYWSIVADIFAFRNKLGRADDIDRFILEMRALIEQRRESLKDVDGARDSYAAFFGELNRVLDCLSPNSGSRS